MDKKIGYKGFNLDSNNNLNCRGFIFEVGKEYSVSGKLKLCENGFHFCWALNNIHQFYPLLGSVICEVEVTGDILNDARGIKSCTNKIKISRILTKEDVLKNSNSGYNNSGVINSGNGNSGSDNSGSRNSGDRNSGYNNSGNDNSGSDNSGNSNSGYNNSGDRNSGNSNSGNDNSGYFNSGNGNSGNSNSGNRNSGYNNSGSRNSGNFNSGDRNSGYFNNTDQPVRIFNKDIEMNHHDIQKVLDLCRIELTEWILYTEEEKSSDESKVLIGGWLKTFSYKEAWKNKWQELEPWEKDMVKALPNFDAEVFEDITGIRVD